MQSPTSLNLKNAAKLNLQILQTAFNKHYFKQIDAASLDKNFTEDFMTFHAISKEGKEFDKSIRDIKNYYA